MNRTKAEIVATTKLSEIRYLTDSEGNYDPKKIKDVDFDMFKQWCNIQHYETYETAGWKSYVVEKRGHLCISLECFIFTNAQAEDYKIPQEYLNKEIEREANLIAEHYHTNPVFFSYDKDKNPTVIMLIEDRCYTREKLVHVAAFLNHYLTYDCDKLAKSYYFKKECEYAV